MSNNKQSSVDWLVKQLNQKIDYIPMSQWDEITEVIEQAKAMHWEENADTWNNAINAVEKNKWDSFEQYYNETFGCSDSLNESRNFGNETQDVFQGD